MSAPACVLSHGIGRKTEDRLLQRGTTRGCHGAGVVLHAASAGAEADMGGVRAKRCRGIRLPKLYWHRNDGNHTQYCGSCTLPPA